MDLHLHIVKETSTRIIFEPRVTWILIIVGIIVAVVDILGVMISVL